MMENTDNLRIKNIEAVANPVDLLNDLPVTETAAATVAIARNDTHKILHGEDDRLLVVVGPCSIHDTDAALEYAHWLLKLRYEFADTLHIVMRVYFEKPRTRIGWKGLINDPDLTDTFDINKGLRVARKLLLDISDLGMPAATEYLDLITPQYVSDLVSWAAIGARTTESQGHRELSSGVSCPIGFKNGTYGNMNIAIDAIAAANREHRFLSVTQEGHSAIFTTTGNEDCHIILRGGREPNYDQQSVERAVEELRKAKLSPCLMVDMSHANSCKNYKNQAKVAASIVEQVENGSYAICGVMIESHLQEGRQDAKGRPLADLVYGQSITDACIGLDATAQILQQLAEAVKKRREVNKNANN
ncbi:MAG TPA: 3-deoxy-7-phosphoheptulonate synthase [Thiothrix sp.]|nr:3-deoxy-7-phosphoheptulonate synthase [Thiothrix sp.]